MACVRQTSIADPDPYVLGLPDRSSEVRIRIWLQIRILHHQTKIVQKPWFLLFLDFLMTFIFEKQKLCKYNFKK